MQYPVSLHTNMMKFTNFICVYNILSYNHNNYGLLSYKRYIPVISHLQPSTNICIWNLVIGTSSISRYAPFPLNYTSRLMTLKMFQFNSFDPENFLMLFINFYRIVSYLQRIKLEQFCFVIFNYKYSSILRKV